MYHRLLNNLHTYSTYPTFCSLSVLSSHEKSYIPNQRKLLPDEVGFRVFSDLKTLHVVISHNVFTGHEFDLGDWVKVALGGLSSPALNGKCSVVEVEKINDDHFRQWTV